mgnify:CR=1 FL=1
MWSSWEAWKASGGLEMSKLAGAQLLISGGLTWLALKILSCFTFQSNKAHSGSFCGLWWPSKLQLWRVYAPPYSIFKDKYLSLNILWPYSHRAKPCFTETGRWFGLNVYKRRCKAIGKDPEGIIIMSILPRQNRSSRRVVAGIMMRHSCIPSFATSCPNSIFQKGSCSSELFWSELLQKGAPCVPPHGGLFLLFWAELYGSNWVRNGLIYRIYEIRPFGSFWILSCNLLNLDE